MVFVSNGVLSGIADRVVRHDNIYGHGDGSDDAGRANIVQDLHPDGQPADAHHHAGGRLDRAHRECGRHAVHPVTASGGFGAIIFALSGGALPRGLSFSTSSGQITGTPTGLFAATTFTVTATDQTTPVAQTSSTTFSLAVNLPTFTTTQAVASTILTVNVAATPFTPVTASGGFGSISFALSGGALPAGLSFSSSTGQLTGTPTALFAATTFTVTATDQSTPVAQTSPRPSA